MRAVRIIYYYIICGSRTGAQEYVCKKKYTQRENIGERKLIKLRPVGARMCVCVCVRVRARMRFLTKWSGNIGRSYTG